MSQPGSDGAAEPARPDSIEAAAEMLAAASAAGARLRIGPDVSLERLDRVLEHEAGTSRAPSRPEFGSRLCRRRSPRAGQRLSLDPPGDPTVGACLARRLSGPLSHRFGTPRDLVLGVTLVLGDGTVASSGGKVVKNVAGYDLGKLVCGSEGRLALIARVALRLHPLPAASATMVVETSDARRRRARAPRVPLCSRARSTSSIPGASPSSSRAPRPRSRRRSRPPARSSAVHWRTGRSGKRPGARQAESLGRLAFAPRDLANVLSTLDEAIVRPAAGIAYVPHRVGGVPDAAARRIQRALKERLDPRECS